MAKKEEVKDVKKEEVATLKVTEDSLANDKHTTAPGINAGKRPKFGKNEFGV